MNEENMDKKKKNEDEKEVINFMELVEENLSNVGNEKNEITKNDNDESIKNDVFENKPLQDVNDQINLSDEINNLEYVGSDEDFIVGRSSSEVGDIITEEILEDLKESLIKEEDLKENFITKQDFKEKSIKDGDLQENLIKDEDYKENITKDEEKIIQEDLKNLNKHIKKMALDKQVPSSNIILRKNDTLEIRTPFHNEDIRIHKYPGFLYINIYAIEKYFSADMDVQSVFIRMESDDFIYETEDYAEDTNIKMNSLVHLSLSSGKDIKLNFIMNKRTTKGIIKSCECVVNINRDFLDKIHNTLYEVSHEWSPYSSRNLIKSFFSFFTYSVADAYSLKLYFSFISEEEFKVIGVPIPTSLFDLGRWLKIRKHAYNTWFSGFCNIRGNVTNICTHLWKRRYIKIYGYKIYIFNEHTKSLMGIFNLISTMTKERKIFEKDNKIRIENNKNYIEFHFESNDKYNTFRNVLEALI